MGWRPATKHRYVRLLAGQRALLQLESHEVALTLASSTARRRYISLMIMDLIALSRQTRVWAYQYTCLDLNHFSSM